VGRSSRSVAAREVEVRRRRSGESGKKQKKWEWWKLMEIGGRIKR
jgi:hypothetical protein